MENQNMINKYRQQLMYLSNQKQQLQMQSNILDTTLAELKKSKEEKVYKGVGNILILSDKKDVIKNTEDLKETIKLKLSNIDKQEEETIKKLNSLSRKDSLAKKSKNEDNIEGVS